MGLAATRGAPNAAGIEALAGIQTGFTQAGRARLGPNSRLEITRPPANNRLRFYSEPGTEILQVVGLR